MSKATLKEKRNDSIRQIMAAATEIFAENGFAGARMDEIAKRASINKAMIYYRIGDKKALYDKVLHDLFANIASRMADDLKDDRGPEEKLLTYISNLNETIDQNPGLPHIMMQEIASGGRNFTELVAMDILRILSVLKSIIKEGVTSGSFIKVDALALHMMIMGAIVFYKASVPVRKKHFSLVNKNIMSNNEYSPNNFVKEIEKVVIRAVKK